MRTEREGKIIFFYEINHRFYHIKLVQMIPCNDGEYNYGNAETELNDLFLLSHTSVQF